MDAAYDEFGSEEAFVEQDVERVQASLGDMAGVPCAPPLRLFGSALGRITTLYHPFDLGEAGIDASALLCVMGEDDVLHLIEEWGVEQSITPSEAERVMEGIVMQDVFAVTADYGVRRG